jgi:hypothetical protein
MEVSGFGCAAPVGVQRRFQFGYEMLYLESVGRCREVAKESLNPFEPRNAGGRKVHSDASIPPQSSFHPEILRVLFARQLSSGLTAARLRSGRWIRGLMGTRSRTLAGWH